MTATGNLAGTVIQGNQFVDSATGVVLSGATNLTINGNNTISGGTTGLLAVGINSGSVFQNNTIDGDNQAMTYGASLLSSQGLLFGGDAVGLGNTVEAAAYGVFAQGALANAVIAGNQIKDGVNGIQLSGVAGLAVNGNNVISGNKLAGIYSSGANAGTTVSNNTIQFNGNGLYLQGSSLAVTLNTISLNTGDGVLVSGATAINNAITSNSISGNGGLGIRLSAGGNSGQPSPTLAAAALNTGFVQITGSLTASPNSIYWVQYFVSPAGEDEGQTFLETATVVTDASGIATLNQVVVQGAIVAGDVITATATLLQGGAPKNTSAFSSWVTVL